MPSMLDAAARNREQAAAYLDASKVPGYLAGVYHDGGQAVIAHGIANVATGAPMREDPSRISSWAVIIDPAASRAAGRSTGRRPR